MHNTADVVAAPESCTHGLCNKFYEDVIYTFSYLADPEVWLILTSSRRSLPAPPTSTAPS